MNHMVSPLSFCQSVADCLTLKSMISAERDCHFTLNVHMLFAAFSVCISRFERTEISKRNQQKAYFCILPHWAAGASFLKLTRVA